MTWSSMSKLEGLACKPQAQDCLWLPSAKITEDTSHLVFDVGSGLGSSCLHHRRGVGVGTHIIKALTELPLSLQALVN